MEHILSLSYGKDSIACLEAIKQLGWQLDRVIHAEIWATDTIPADLPPMVEFKVKADRIIKERYGIEVEHVRAKKTYEQLFYQKRLEGAKYGGLIYGFPRHVGNWCNSWLKRKVLKIKSSDISYLGIAADEPERIERHLKKKNVRLPLVEIGWDEAYCRKWCEENDLLSPIYTDSTRSGCWFCHNQPIDQLRLLRKNYPEYWAMLLRWDIDSPFPFKGSGQTVHDFDLRFTLEEKGLVTKDRTFRWKMLDEYKEG